MFTNCIVSLAHLSEDVGEKFNEAIKAWDYCESKNFMNFDLNLRKMPFSERAKLARWCMGNRCENNKQIYTPV